MSNAPVYVTLEANVAFVTIANPPVNALGQAVREGLKEAAERLEANSLVKAVVLRCAGSTFIAGADIRELGKAPLRPFLPDVLRSIESSGKPWVAAIQGSALGGGLEIAMACHGRVAERDAKFGLPEVTLGIIPGSGGTVRLPRLVPMERAFEMVTGGKTISADLALRDGLIDRVAEEDLQIVAHSLATELAARGAPTSTIDRPIVDGARAFDFAAARNRVEARARGAKAPFEAAMALQDAVDLQPEEALAAERERFLRLAGSFEAKALRHAFFAERAAGRSLRELPAEPADLSHVGIVGGGTMGAGIATALLLAGASVHLVERDGEASAKARQRVAVTLGKSVDKGVISLAQSEEAIGRLWTGADFSSLTVCPLVIEAVFEDVSVKAEVFARLDETMPADAILATNTSYLDVDIIADATLDPTRILGLHFFSPAHVMKLLEIVRGARTGDRALATGAALARKLRKTSVAAGNCTGFIGNRIMAAYRRDAEFMLEEGALPEEVDAAMREFGFAMGIFEVQDLSGLDIAWAMRKAKEASRLPSERYARIADRLCEEGRFGRKSGAGWYAYASGKPTCDPHVASVIEEESARKGITRRRFSSREINDRILSIMQREGSAILDEGMAESPGDIDVVMIAGYGFPRHKGGPMFLMNASTDSQDVA